MADATNPYPTQRTRIKEGYLGRVSHSCHKWRLRHDLGDGFAVRAPTKGARTLAKYHTFPTKKLPALSFSIKNH